DLLLIEQQIPPLAPMALGRDDVSPLPSPLSPLPSSFPPLPSPLSRIFHRSLQQESSGMFAPLLLAALVQQGQVPQQQASLPPSPVARIEVTPARPVVAAQDSLQLRARALDASGNPVASATIRFAATGAQFEGRVSPEGMVLSG